MLLKQPSTASLNQHFIPHTQSLAKNMHTRLFQDKSENTADTIHLPGQKERPPVKTTGKCSN